MNARNTRSLANLRRSHDFIVLHERELGTITNTLSWRALYNAIQHIERRLELKLAAADCRRTANSDVHEFRQRLSLAIRSAFRRAAAILGEAGELAPLSSPRPNAAAAELIRVGYHMADIVGRHRRAFARRGLNLYAAENLRTLASRLESLINNRQDIDRFRTKSTAEIEAYLERGRKARWQLDALIEVELARSPHLLATWKATRSAPAGPAQPLPLSNGAQPLNAPLTHIQA